jgi:hypothetical protein
LSPIPEAVRAPWAEAISVCTPVQAQYLVQCLRLNKCLRNGFVVRREEHSVRVRCPRGSHLEHWHVHAWRMVSAHVCSLGLCAKPFCRRVVWSSHSRGKLSPEKIKFCVKFTGLLTGLPEAEFLCYCWALGLFVFSTNRVWWNTVLPQQLNQVYCETNVSEEKNHIFLSKW